jgi:3-dehydroquinate synthase
MPSLSDRKTLHVDLGVRGYPVIVGEGILGDLGMLMHRQGLSGKVAVISQPGVFELYGDRVVHSLREADFDITPLLIPEGEEHKNLQTVEDLYDRLLAAHFERSSSIVALGGGCVGDTAGWAAASLYRGIHLVQVPTTLLAQVDAAIGGKVGVNHSAGKNLIGAFYQPRLVLSDVTTLHTLPERELRSGLAEVIKYGVIRSSSLFGFIEQNLEALLSCHHAGMQLVVSECSRLKADIVQQDERESGTVRVLLNFGHTIGHALESLGGYRQLRHGEAVAVGMAAAARLGSRLTGFDEADLDRLVRLLKRAGFKLDPGPWDESEIIAQTHRDKKVHRNRVNYVLPRAFGEVEPMVPVSDEEARQALLWLRAEGGKS